MKKNWLIVLMVVVLIVAIILLFSYKLKGANKNSNTLPGATNPGTNSGVNLSTVSTEKTKFPLRYGSKGKAVKMIQYYFGISVDGVWGNETENTVRENLGTDQITEQFFEDSILAAAYDFDRRFPITSGMRDSIVIPDIQIMLEIPVTETFDNETKKAVVAAFGKDSISQNDYLYLANKILGVSVI